MVKMNYEVMQKCEKMHWESNRVLQITVLSLALSSLD